MRYIDAVEQALQGILPPPQPAPMPEAPEGNAIPQPLSSAMAYSLLQPGKRLRPLLLLASYHMLAEDWEAVLPFACAIEMIHTYSLIHDDLPAMDNDDLRRGRPTNHKVYGEAMAILAGDGLLNLAYETMLSSAFARKYPERSLCAMGEIATRAGVRGMVAGQSLDVELEGKPVNLRNVSYIHHHKTADLLTAPVVAGLLLAGASREQLSAGAAFGQHMGLAFQIQDDILDTIGDEKLMGKRLNKDANLGKNTWCALFGIDKAQADAAKELSLALEALQPFEEKASELKKIAQELAGRQK